MNQEQLEKKMQDAYQNYSPQLDQSEMWSEIDRALGEEPRKKKTLLWFFLSILFIGCNLFFINNYKQNEEKISTPINSQKELTSDTKKLDTPYNSNKKKEVLLKTNSTIESEVHSGQSMSVIEKPEEKNFDALINIEGNNSKVTISPIREVRNLEKSVTQNTIALTRKSSSNIIVDQLEKIPSLQFGLTRIVNEYKLAISNNSIENIEEDENSPWNLNIGMSYGMVSSDFVSNDAMGDDIINLQKNNVNDDHLLSMDGTLLFDLHPNWSIGFGFDYNRIVTNGLYTSSSQYNTTLTDTVLIIYNATGKTIEYGPREFVVKSTKTYRRFNKYHQILAPIKIQYQNSLNDKWGYQLVAGYAFSLWSKNKGFDQELNDMEYSIDTDVDQRIRKSKHQKLIFGTHMTRSFMHEGEFYIGIQYVKDLNGIYNNNYLIQKKMNALQIKAGIAIPLNFKN